MTTTSNRLAGAPIPVLSDLETPMWRTADDGRLCTPRCDGKVGVVALDGVKGDPVRLVTNVFDAWDDADLRVGQRVRLSCLAVADAVGLPCFVRADCASDNDSRVEAS